MTVNNAPTTAMALIATALVLSGCVTDYGYGGPAYLYDAPVGVFGNYGWGGWHHGWDHGHWHGGDGAGHGLAPVSSGHGFGGHAGFGGHGGGGGGGHGGGGHR